jgi:branched-chain amino acid transport system permease protein
MNMKQNPNTKILWCIAIAAAALLPLGLDPQGYYLRLAAMVLLFAAAGQAWNIVGGLANQISLGHAAFFGIGAYTSTLLYLRLGVSPWIGLFVGAVLAALVAMLLCIPLFKLRGHYFALATLAFAEVLKIIANSWSSLTGGALGLTIPYRGNDVVNYQFESPVLHYWTILAVLLVCSFVFHRFATGATGYRMRAIRNDEVAAEVAGIDTFRLKIVASMWSAALTAVCGTVFAQFIYFFDPEAIFSLVSISVRIAMIVIIGGMGTIAGPIVGAIFLVPLEDVCSLVFSDAASGVSQLVFGAVIIIAVLVEPRGIVALVKRVMTRKPALVTEGNP